MPRMMRRRASVLKVGPGSNLRPPSPCARSVTVPGSEERSVVGLPTRLTPQGEGALPDLPRSRQYFCNMYPGPTNNSTFAAALNTATPMTPPRHRHNAL